MRLYRCLRARMTARRRRRRRRRRAAGGGGGRTWDEMAWRRACGYQGKPTLEWYPSIVSLGVGVEDKRWSELGAFASARPGRSDDTVCQRHYPMRLGDPLPKNTTPVDAPPPSSTASSTPSTHSSHLQNHNLASLLFLPVLCAGAFAFPHAYNCSASAAFWAVTHVPPKKPPPRLPRAFPSQNTTPPASTVLVRVTGPSLTMWMPRSI